MRGAEAIARIRQSGKEHLQSTRNYRHRQDSTSLGGHILGAKGEIACAKYFGWIIDPLEAPRGDGGRDFLVGLKSIDVQTTKYYPAHLKYDRLHPLRADAAVLVRERSLRVMELVGWITTEDFLDASFTADYGYGVRDVVGIRQLQPIEIAARFSVTLRRFA